MTDYVKSTNFASKDSLSIGNPLKIVKGTEIDAEFNNIATAVATKADIANPTFTGVPAAPTASSGTNSSQLATTAFVTAAVTAYDTALTVSTAQIENDAVTADKIASGAVGNTELATDAVTQAKMADNSVGTAELINANVTTAKLADANVTATKLDGAQSGTAPIYGARAWVNFNGTGTIGTNQTIRSSGNVASVYKNGTGDYTITFTTALPNANYAVAGASQTVTGNVAVMTGAINQTDFAKTTSSFRIGVFNSASGNAIDVNSTNVVIFG
jgi:hypothetical protein